MVFFLRLLMLMLLEGAGKKADVLIKEELRLMVGNL
jgi:hypothetical protein